jgi:hypothetical protein
VQGYQDSVRGSGACAMCPRERCSWSAVGVSPCWEEGGILSLFLSRRDREDGEASWKSSIGSGDERGGGVTVHCNGRSRESCVNRVVSQS